MAEYRTILLDPTSSTQNRVVWKIDAGLRVMAKKVRVINFGLSNLNGDGIYFNHAGVYSLVSRVSINNSQGQEIDRLINPSAFMGLKLLHMPNSSQFSLARQMSQNMCSSIFCNSFSQVALTEQSQRDDATLMGNSLYLDISFMLNFLMSRNIIESGYTLTIEWAGSDVLGYEYSFTRPPVLCLDEVLTPVPADPPASVYLTIVPDKVTMSAGDRSFERRLNSYYNQFIQNLMYFNIGSKSDNLLELPLGRIDEKVELTINSMKLIPLKGIDSFAKKLAILHDRTTELTTCNYGAFVPLAKNGSTNVSVPASRGLYNPNLGIHYDANFSYGCIGVEKYVGQDITLSYSMRDAVPEGKTDTIYILAEVLRSYDERSGNVSFAGTPQFPVNSWSS
jgi:hypothetical protein